MVFLLFFLIYNFNYVIIILDYFLIYLKYLYVRFMINLLINEMVFFIYLVFMLIPLIPYDLILYQHFFKSFIIYNILACHIQFILIHIINIQDYSSYVII